MKNLLKNISLSIAVIVSIMSVGTLIPAPATAINPFQTCNGDTTSSICKGQNDKLFGPDSIWTKIINILLIIVGVAAVIVIIIGGLKYVVSGGDPAGITAAKNTILYAVVGLVVAIMAGAIVNFVLSKL